MRYDVTEGTSREETHLVRPINLNVHVHNPDVEETLERIEMKLDALLLQGEIEMADLTAVTAEVAQETDVEQSAIVLLNNLSQMLRDSATDPAAIQALADQMDANNTALAAAVAANTPAAPAAAAPPTEPAPPAE